MDGTERIIAQPKNTIKPRQRSKKLCCEWRFQETIVEQRCAHFCFTWIGGKLTAQSTGSHTGIGGGIQIPETLLEALLPFPPPHHQSTPESLLAGYPQGKPTTCTLYPGKKVKAHMSQRPKWPKLIRVSLV